MKLELIFFRDCPHVDQTRSNLYAALTESGIRAPVSEWDQDDPAAPAYVRGYASPTVLVNGRDVSGDPVSSGAPSCRIGGAPTTQAIRRAIEGQ